jgi:hypothetical protein
MFMFTPSAGFDALHQTLGGGDGEPAIIGDRIFRTRARPA